MFFHKDVGNGLYLPKDSEGGHLDFVARTIEDIEICDYISKHLLDEDKRGKWPVMDDIVSGNGVAKGGVKPDAIVVICYVIACYS